MEDHFSFGKEAEGSKTLESLESLVRDLKAVIAGAAPTPSELEYAPLIKGYQIAPYTAFCLSGRVSGHPLLGDASIHTSQLWALDSKAGWARTFSRWYRLGPSLQDIREELERRRREQSSPH